MSGQRPEEDLMQNPFLRVLRASFEGMYRRAAERREATTILVPCAECLEGESFNQIFMETHVLQASRVPGCFMNLCGQGLELKDASVSTSLGFAEMRTCEVLQTESMYDYGSTFRVVVLDRPLIGKYRTVQGAADRSAAAARASANAAAPPGGLRLPSVGDPGDLPAEWLAKAPSIEKALFEEVDRFRKTFVQVPGCEASTAERIREIAGDAVRKLIKHHRLTQPTQQRQLEHHVSRNTYAALHSFLFPHLQRILATAEERLEKGIRSYSSVKELVEAIPDAQGRGLGMVDLQTCSQRLEDIDSKITPHEKIACVDEAHSMLQQCVAEGAKASGSADGGVIEITGDDVLSLFILAVYRSGLRCRLAHVAHMEMYLSGGSEAARFEEAGYAVSALQAALQFFLEDHRQMAAARNPPRPSTSVFSSYLGAAGTIARSEHRSASDVMDDDAKVHAGAAALPVNFAPRRP